MINVKKYFAGSCMQIRLINEHKHKPNLHIIYNNKTFFVDLESLLAEHSSAACICAYKYDLQNL